MAELLVRFADNVRVSMWSLTDVGAEGHCRLGRGELFRRKSRKHLLLPDTSGWVIHTGSPPTT